MVDWLPIDPILDATVRHGADRLPYYYGLGVIYAWNLWKWEKQKRYGMIRDAKDREQDRRLDALDNKYKMFPLETRIVGGYRFGSRTAYSLHHLGVDYRAPKGTLLRAPFDGEIIAQYSGLEGGKMIYYRPDHDNVVMRFLHLSEYQAPKGRVSKGQVIAKTGNTGLGVALGKLTFNSVDHLHLDISREPSKVLAGKLDFSQFTDPEKYDWAGPETHVPVEVPQSPAPASFGRFDQNLEPSQARRPEVERMQRFLKSKGFFPDIAENEYGYYGKKTQAAVDRFQKANGIPKATKYGYWYDLTRSKANQQLNV